MTDLEDAVNSNQENLRKWLVANKLSLNVAQTELCQLAKNMTKHYQLLPSRHF